MNILIVENNKKDLEETKRLFNQLSQELQLEMKLHVEDNYEQVLQINHQFDIVMMDIELNEGCNGIDLAKQIRNHNKDIRIVFLSNYNQYLLDGYKAKADLYLLKPIQQDVFNHEISEVIRESIYHNQGIVDERLSQTKIYFKDILYIEVLSRKLNIHLVSGEVISCYDTLLKWMELLKECPFSQPHRSFFVNLEHILKYEKKSIQLINNQSIPITDVYQNKFKTDYIRYLNRRA